MDFAALTAGIVVKFATDECTRCTGTGYFGPSSIEGGRCFTCRGAKVVLSRSGKAAKKRFDAITDKMTATVQDVQPGDIVQAKLSKGYNATATAWVKVTEVKEASGACMISTDADGKEIRVPFIEIGFEPEARLDGWTMPLTQLGFSIKVWNLDTYREAAKAVARLKGATVTGL